jgi:hypothetical protein
MYILAHQVHYLKVIDIKCAMRISLINVILKLYVQVIFNTARAHLLHKAVRQECSFRHYNAVVRQIIKKSVLSYSFRQAARYSVSILLNPHKATIKAEIHVLTSIKDTSRPGTFSWFLMNKEAHSVVRNLLSMDVPSATLKFSTNYIKLKQAKVCIKKLLIFP